MTSVPPNLDNRGAGLETDDDAIGLSLCNGGIIGAESESCGGDEIAAGIERGGKERLFLADLERHRFRCDLHFGDVLASGQAGAGREQISRPMTNRKQHLVRESAAGSGYSRLTRSGLRGKMLLISGRMHPTPRSARSSAISKACFT